MEGKDVPEEDRRPDAGQYIPHDTGGAFPDHGAPRRTPQRQPPPDGVFVQTLVVGESQSGSPAAAVTVVAADPQGVHGPTGRGFKHRQQVRGPPFGGVHPVVNGAAVRVRVEYMVEFELLEGIYEMSRGHGGRPFWMTDPELRRRERYTSVPSLRIERYSS